LLFLSHSVFFHTLYAQGSMKIFSPAAASCPGLNGRLIAMNKVGQKSDSTKDAFWLARLWVFYSSIHRLDAKESKVYLSLIDASLLSTTQCPQRNRQSLSLNLA
jgi:hypothetical protein